MLKKLLKLTGNLFTVLCFAIIGIAFISLLQSMGEPDKILTIVGYRPGVVISGSMAPALKPGDMIISKIVDPRDIQIGDIITYRVDGTIPNSHRVVRLVEKDGQIMFETKGDAVNVKDGGLILPDRLIGRIVYVIPRAGYIVEFLKSPFGFTIVIILPIILLVIVELIPLFKRKGCLK